MKYILKNFGSLLLVLKTTLNDIYICFKDNHDKYEAILKMLLGRYDAVTISTECDDAVEKMRKKYIVSIILRNLNINYVFES